jgi:hypothetical protein
MTNTNIRCLATVTEVQLILDREIKDHILQLEQRVHDAKLHEWWSEVAKLEAAVYEANHLKHKVSVALHAMWMDAAEQMESDLKATFEVTKIATVEADKLSVELPEIAAKHRTVSG